MNLLIKQIETLQESCVRCPIRTEIRRKFTNTLAINFCETKCPSGIKIKEKQQALEIDVTRLSMVKHKLSQNEYIKLSEKHTDKEICELTGITRTTLTRRKKAWGLQKTEKKLEEHTYPEYVELRNSGLSNAEIAEAWGVARNTLYRFLEPYKKLGHIKKLEDKDKKDYLKLSYQMSDEEIAESWGVSKRTLGRWKQVHGLSYN